MPDPQERVAERCPFGWDSLTEAELAATELVTGGLTTREIGARLFKSHHTGYRILTEIDIAAATEMCAAMSATEPTSAVAVPHRAARPWPISCSEP